ncbi:MAG: hypothetical protein PHH84_02510 [Oscillospiraceae bacterium]|nr:hypothetical protein [Oscillospiraceae bacterium]
MPDNKFMHDSGCKEAVCIDAGRVYDSCSDKDCLEDLRVYFTEREQMVIDRAVSVRAKKACVITTYIDIEPLPFNRGYFSCDLTIFFHIEVEAFTSRNCPPAELCGICVFRKRVILFGSEGSVKVFSSEFSEDDPARQQPISRNMPVCKVQVAEPIVLSACVVDACERRKCKCDCDCGCSSIPEGIANNYGGAFIDPDEGKAVYVTLGIFTIVQLIRNVQMLVPVYDFCIPTKDCSETGDEPCDLFRKMLFPIDEFFPPNHDKDKPGCGCDRKK